MAVEELEEGVEGCDACEKQMWSKFEAEMSGEVYDRDTFEVGCWLDVVAPLVDVND